MWQFFLIFLLSSLVCSFGQAGAPAFQESKLVVVGESEAWRRILHFKPRWISGRLQSKNEGADFFLSPRGREDSVEELRQTIKAFWSDTPHGKLKQPAVCAFPWRLKFLKKELGISPPPRDCPELKRFLGQFQAHSVSLVFSSAAPNNPASMFGHTFLKINSKSSELLDWGINFAAATPEDENPLRFVAWGLTGGYVGQFSMQPYFQKVNEYVHAESRDLWEYELSLSPEESVDLLKHLWELETNGEFDYYFLDENCSYQLLAAIEAIRPAWKLTDFSLHVIPADTIKKVMSISGAVTQVKFRPSLQRQFKSAYVALNPVERDEFLKVSKSRDGASVEKINSVAVLNALAVQYSYDQQRQKHPPNPAYRAQLLGRRSRFPPGDLAKVSEPPTRPELGHDSYRLGVWGGASRRQAGDQNFVALSLKTAYHDLLNRDVGYAPLTQIDGPALDLRFNLKESRISIEKITGVEVTSLYPLGLLEQRLSWKLSAYSWNVKDFGCDECHVLHFDGGVGATTELFTPTWVGFTMAVLQSEVGDSFGKGYRYGPGIHAGFIWQGMEDFKFMATGYHWWDLQQEDRPERYIRGSLDAAYAFERNWDFRSGYQKIWHPQAGSYGEQNQDEQIQLQLNRYF